MSALSGTSRIPTRDAGWSPYIIITVVPRNELCPPPIARVARSHPLLCQPPFLRFVATTFIAAFSPFRNCVEYATVGQDS